MDTKLRRLSYLWLNIVLCLSFVLSPLLLPGAALAMPARSGPSQASGPAAPEPSAPAPSDAPLTPRPVEAPQPPTIDPADDPAALLIRPEQGGEIAAADGRLAVRFEAHGLPRPLSVSLGQADDPCLPANLAPLSAVVDVRGRWLGAAREQRLEEEGSAEDALGLRGSARVAALDVETASTVERGSGKPKPVASRYWATVRIALPSPQAADSSVAIAIRAVDGRKWELLQTDFQDGFAVARTDRLGYLVLAKNMALAAAVAPAALEVIVDDLDAGFQIFTMGWPESGWTSVPCSGATCWAGNMQWMYNRSDAEPLPLGQRWDWATWTPTLTDPGWYKVEVFIPGINANTSGANYQITHAGQTDSVVVDQSLFGAAWKNIGVYEFNAGGGEQLYLDDVVPEEAELGSKIGFDAARFTFCPDPDACQPDTEPPVISDVEWRQDGAGKTIVMATITDNVAVAAASLFWNGVEYPMALMDADRYYAIIPVQLNGSVAQFTISAVDPSGNAACWPAGCTPAQTRTVYTRWVAQVRNTLALGEPVNTATGSFFTQHQDVVAPAPGIPLEFKRTYNSMLGAVDGPLGFGWTHSFNASLKVVDDPLLHGVVVTYPDGHIANFTASGGGYTSPPGDLNTLMHEGSGFVLVQPDQVEYHFDSAGRLTSISDRNDNTVQLAYTGANLTQITDTAGRVYLLEYTGSRIAKITDLLGRAYQYTYDGAGNLIAYVDPEGGLIQYTYNGEHWMLSITDPNGHTFVTNEYDARGRVVKQTDASGSVSTLSYPDELHAVLTDNEGHLTTHTYDAEHRLVDNKDALGRSITREYDASSNMIRTVDRGGHATVYTYDSRGNMLTRTDASGGVATFQYDARNNVTYKKDEAGAETRFQYDARGNLIRITDTLGGNTAMTYDSRGLLLTRTDALGHTTSYDYDAQGNPISTRDPLHHSTSNAYDAMGRRIAMTDGNGHTARFEFNGNDRLIRTVDPKGLATVFVYDGVGNLKSVTDRRGFSTFYAYNENDSLVQVTDARGQATTHTYDLMYHRTSTTNPRGYTTSYELDAVYNIVRIIDAKGGVSTTEYDADGNRTRVTDALSNITQLEYDALHRLVKLTNALDGVTEYTYDPLGRVTLVTDPKGGVTASEYDALGRLVKLTDALDGVTSFTYDAVGNRLTARDPRGSITRYAYDANNRLTQQIDPLGHTQRFEYDGVGNLARRTDARGNCTNFEYDENDSLVLTTDALGGQVAYAYDEEGNQVSVTDQNGHTTLTQYDPLAHVVAVTLPLLQQTTYGHDENGNPISITNAKGNTTTLAYDETDLLVSRTDPLDHVTRYTYDLLGRMTQVTDAEGNPTLNRYDALGRLVEVIDALNGHTAYEYDPLGNLTAYTDANAHRTTFYVDLLGRTTGEHNPLGNTWQYEFDAAGNLVERTDAKGVVTEHTYDAGNRLVHTTYPSGPGVDLGYDENDNLVSVADGSGAASLTYDALNRLTQMQRTAGILATKALQYRYDAAGNRTAITYPGGQVVSYAFNANDWLATVSDPIAGATQYTYDAVGLPIVQQNPNGTRTEYAYDGADRLVKLLNLKPQTSTDLISSFEYTLDKVGNRTRTIEKVTRGQLITWTEDYTYDALYRLTRAVETPDYLPAQIHISEFVYDPVGNRLAQTTNILDAPNTPPLPSPITTEYTYNAANQMLTAGRTQFAYDANGNRVSMAGATRAIDYRYDWENRLAGAETFNIFKGGKRQKDAVLDYSYDGLGRRLERGIREKGVRKTAQFLYDALGYDLLAQYAQPQDPHETLYFRDLSQMLSRVEIHDGDEADPGVTTQWYGYAHDGLGSISAWSNLDGAAVQEYKYAPYGRLIDNNGPDNASNKTSPHNTVTFSGKLWDNELETYYFGARDYDPGTGVWLTQDVYRGRPAEPATLHRYQYTRNNPITWVDLYGFDGNQASNPWAEPWWSSNTAASLMKAQVSIASMYGKESGKCFNGGTLPSYWWLWNTFGSSASQSGLFADDRFDVNWLSELFGQIDDWETYVTKPAEIINAINKLAQIDRRFKVTPFFQSFFQGVEGVNPWWSQVVPKAVQRSWVLKTRALIGKIPGWSKLSAFGSAVAKVEKALGGAPMITFVIAPFAEVGTSAKMIQQRMDADPNAAQNEGWYAVAGAFDAASFGIVRNFVKTPELILGNHWKPVSDWADRNLNAGAAADWLTAGYAKVSSW